MTNHPFQLRHFEIDELRAGLQIANDRPIGYDVPGKNLEKAATWQQIIFRQCYNRCFDVENYNKSFSEPADRQQHIAKWHRQNGFGLNDGEKARDRVLEILDRILDSNPSYAPKQSVEQWHSQCLEAFFLNDQPYRYLMHVVAHKAAEAKQPETVALDKDNAVWTDRVLENNGPFKKIYSREK